MEQLWASPQWFQPERLRPLGRNRLLQSALRIYPRPSGAAASASAAGFGDDTAPNLLQLCDWLRTAAQFNPFQQRDYLDFGEQLHYQLLATTRHAEAVQVLVKAQHEANNRAMSMEEIDTNRMRQLMDMQEAAGALLQRAEQLMVQWNGMMERTPTRSDDGATESAAVPFAVATRRFHVLAFPCSVATTRYFTPAAEESGVHATRSASTHAPSAKAHSLPYPALVAEEGERETKRRRTEKRASVASGYIDSEQRVGETAAATAATVHTGSLVPVHQPVNSASAACSSGGQGGPDGAPDPEDVSTASVINLQVMERAMLALLEENLHANLHDLATYLKREIPDAKFDERRCGAQDATRMSQDVRALHEMFTERNFVSSRPQGTLVQRMEDVSSQLALSSMLGLMPVGGATASATASAQPSPTEEVPSETSHVFFLLAHGVSQALIDDQARQQLHMQRHQHDSRRLQTDRFDWLSFYDLLGCKLSLGDVVAFSQVLSLDHFVSLFVNHIIATGEQHLVLVLDSCLSGQWAEKLREWLRQSENAALLQRHRCSITVHTACGPFERALGGVFTPLFIQLQQVAWRASMVASWKILTADEDAWREFCAEYSCQQPDYCSSEDVATCETPPNRSTAARASAPFTESRGLVSFSNPDFFLHCMVKQLGGLWPGPAEDSAADYAARLKVCDSPGNPLATNFWQDLLNGTIKIEGCLVAPYGRQKDEPWLKLLVHWPGHPVSTDAGALEYYTLHIHFDGSVAAGLPGKPCGMKVIKCTGIPGPTAGPNAGGPHFGPHFVDAAQQRPLLYQDEQDDRDKTRAGQVAHFDLHKDELLALVETYVKAQLVAVGRDIAEWTQTTLWGQTDKTKLLYVGPFRARSAGMQLAHDVDLAGLRNMPASTAAAAAAESP